MVVVIWGVAGAGKTTIGELLARELSWKFLEGDDLHPQANINKMRSGKPLTDKDRQPWLESLREVIERTIAAHENAVLACSALKQKYRETLRVSDDDGVDVDLAHFAVEALHRLAWFAAANDDGLSADTIEIECV